MSVADPFGLVGQVLDGQFRVDSLVGEGGFSAVYRGHHQGLNEPIAIKSLKLPASIGTALVDTFVQRFRDESRILYRLSQGNLHIVRSIAAGTTQAPATGALVPYMVLEWLEGRSLQNDFTVRRTLGKTGRSLADVIKLFDTAADGLAYAHAQGVVHRDLNPGNLFLATTQQGVKMKVLDFGVAKLMHDGALNMGPRQPTVGQIKIFAPAYGAPEQFDDRIGSVGAFSDVYSFALVLIEALHDKSINEGTHIGEFAARACDPTHRPTPRALGIDVPDEVEAAFARATLLDPKERWQSAGDFWQSLTIANKFAIERRYENAARETPPLAMGNPPPAAAGGKNLSRTLAIGEPSPGIPRPSPSAPGGPRMRVPTAIGIPLPSNIRPPAAAGSVGAARSPSRPDVPAVGAFAKTAATARQPSSASSSSMKAAVPVPSGSAPGPGGSPPQQIPSVVDLEEPEEEATRVRAPEPEMLRTLAMHDVAAARAEADAIIAREMAARAAAAEQDSKNAPTLPPDLDDDVPEPPGSGGTLMMMSPLGLPRAPDGRGGLGSTLAMASPFGPGVPTAGAQHAPELQDWQAPTQAMAAAPVPVRPVGYHEAPQAAPGMIGIPGARGTPPHGMPAINHAPMPPPYGQGHGGNAQFGAPPQHLQPQQQQPQQQQQPFAPPPSFAQPSFAPPPKNALPIVPIAIVLGVLAIGGLVLGGFALRSRRASRVDVPAASASAIVAVPVPVPAPPAPSAAPTPVPDPPAPEVAAPAAAPEAASAPAVAAVTTPPPPTPPPPVTVAQAPAPSPPRVAPNPNAGLPVAAAPASATAPVDPNAFSEPAARQRLAQANGVLAFCKKEGGVTGPGSASVTFAADGSVAGVAVDAPYAGTKEGDCVTSQYRRVKITPFTGSPQTVRTTFDVPK